jgi:hypothetical protein
MYDKCPGSSHIAYGLKGIVHRQAANITMGLLVLSFEWATTIWTFIQLALVLVLSKAISMTRSRDTLAATK